MEILARAVGRRKEAVAQVQIVSGTGQFLINNLPAQEYLQNNSCAMLSVQSPFELFVKEKEENTMNSVVNTANAFQISLSMPLGNMDTIVKVKGGGLIGQAEAIKLAISRALSIIDYSKTDLSVSFNEIRKQLKTKGYLTQDSRVKERRKYGLKKARKASQYHKR